VFFQSNFVHSGLPYGRQLRNSGSAGISSSESDSVAKCFMVMSLTVNTKATSCYD